MPAALHRGLTPMSYCRDGHREPPDPQPTSSSTGDKPLRLSVDIHLIRHHTVRLSNASAWRRRLVVLQLRIRRRPIDGYSARRGRRTTPVLHPALSPYGDAGGPEWKARAGVQLRPWRRGLISGADSAPGLLHRAGLEPRGHRVRQKPAPPAQPGFRRGQRPGSAVRRRILRCAVNVEASHLYPDFPKFLSEVARVLRPGGHFLYTDFRPRSEVAEREAGLAN